MKITSILIDEVIVPAKPGAIDSDKLDRPLHKLPVAGRAGWSIQFDRLPKCIVRIETEDGTIGLGECYRDHDWRVIEGIAEQLLGRQIESLSLQKLPIAHCREHNGFECAIWDTRAKILGVRLVDLLGGPVRETVPVSAWSSHRLPAEMGRVAASFAEQGYECLKLKSDLDDDIAGWCQQIKQAAPQMKVIIDPNERWQRPAEVRRRIDAISRIGNVMCLEDPLPRWMLQEYSRLRGLSPIAIVLHVSLPYVQHGQRIQDAIQALRADAVDGFNFNGGIADFQRLDHIASAAGLPCWHGSEVDLGILEAMYLHCCAAADSCIWPSDIFGRLIRSHDLLKTPLEIIPPLAKVPQGAGLGVQIDVDALDEFRTDQRRYT